MPLIILLGYNLWIQDCPLVGTPLWLIPKTYPGGWIHPRAEDSEFMLEIEGLPKLEYKQDFSLC